MFITVRIGEAGVLLNIVFGYPDPQSFDMTPIVMLTCKYSLECFCSMRSGKPKFFVTRVCDVEIQIPIYFSSREVEKGRGDSLECKKVFPVNLTGPH